MLQFIAAGLSLAEGIFGYRSAKKQAKAQARAARAMAKYNRDVREMEARSTDATMRAETTRSYKQKRQTMASQRVAFSQTGVVSSGSPMAVMLDQAIEMEMDIQNQRRNRLLQSQALRQSGKMSMYEGEMNARRIKAEGKAKATQSLLSGFTQAALGLAKTMPKDTSIKRPPFNKTGLVNENIGYKGLPYNPPSLIDKIKPFK